MIEALDDHKRIPKRQNPKKGGIVNVVRKLRATFTHAKRAIHIALLMVRWQHIILRRRECETRAALL